MLINFQEKQRWGYYNSETAQTIPAQFYDAADFKEGYAIVRKDSSSPYGVIDENGKEILSFSYSSISYEGNHIFKVGSSDFNCLYNQYGNIVDENGNDIPSDLQIYKIVQRIDKDLYHVLTDENKDGIVYEGHLIISFDRYRDVKCFQSGLILMSSGYSNQWLYDLKGNQILTEYSDYNFVSDRYIIVYAGYGKGYGIVDIEKNVIVEAKYSKIEFIGKDTFCLSYKKDHKAEEKTVKINAYEKCFVLALNNTFVQIPINQEFDWCEIISENHIIVSSEFLYGIANSNGDIVLKCEYNQYIKCNSNKNIILQKDNKQYLFNLFTGSCSEGYNTIVQLSPDIFKVCDIESSKYGIINSDFDFVLPLQYNNSLSFVDGKFCFTSSNRKYTITDQAQITLENGVVLSPEITSVESFSDGLAKVKNNKNLWGFIDEDGNIVIPCKFCGNVSDFHEGKASVSVHTRNPHSSFWGETKEWKTTINKNGDFVVKYRDKSIELNSDCQLILDFDSEVTRAYKNGKWALIDPNCILVTQYDYDEIIPLCDGFYKVRQAKLWGVISSSGKTIIQCKHNTINNYGNDLFQIVLSYNQRKISQQLLINHDGNAVVRCGDKQIVIPADYDYIYDFVGDYSIVKKNGKYGIISINGTVVFDCQCDSIHSIANGYAHVTIDKKECLLSLTNSKSIDLPKCNNARYYSDNYIVVGETYPNSSSNRFWIIDRHGTTISKAIYNEINVLDNGNAIVKVSHYPHPKYGVISSNGIEIISPDYYSLQYIQEQNAFLADSEQVYNVETKPHYIDNSGNTVIFNDDATVILPSKYISGRSFSNGLAAVTEEYKTIEEKNKKDKDPFSFDIDWDDILFGDQSKEREVTKSRYGFIDVNGIEQIPCQYDAVTDFKNNLSVVTLNELKGVINTKGDVIVSLEYDDILFLSDTLFKVKKKNLWGVLSITDGIVIPLTYLSIGGISENLIAVKIPEEKSEESGTNTNVRRRPRPISLSLTRRNRVETTPEPKGKWGFVNLNNDIVIDCKYSDVHVFCEGLAAVKESTWKYIDTKSNEIICLPASVSKVTDFCDGMAKITFLHGEREQEHVLLTTGCLLIDNINIQLDFDSITYIEGFHEGLAKVLYDSKWGFVNENGEMVIKDITSEPTSFSDGISSYSNYNGERQNINTQGDIVIQSEKSRHVFPSEYISAKELCTGLFVVKRKLDEQYAVVNSDHKVIIPFQKQDFESFVNEEGKFYLKVRCWSNDNGYGIFYNIDGKRVIPNSDRDIRIGSDYALTANKFCDDLAAVSNKDNLWGFINKLGVEIIPCIYNSVSDFENGYCIVNKDYNIGVIDKSGNIVINIGDFENIKETNNGTWKVTHNQYGHDTTYQTTEYDGYENREVTEHEWISDVRFFNSRSEILIPLYGKSVAIPSEYDWADDAFHEGFLSVCQKGKWGIINTRLELVVNCLYDEKFIFENGIAFAHIGDVTDVIDTSGRLLFSGEFHKINRYDNFNMFVCLSKNRDRFDVYDMLGEFKFSSTSIRSQILIPDSQRLSSNYFSPSNIIPISNKYFKFSISANYEKRRIVSWGICDITGSVIFHAMFDEIGGFGSGLFSVARKTDKRSYYNNLTWGYSDLLGHVVIDFQYSSAKPFINGLAKISKDGSHWGLLSTNGIELTSCIYDEIEYTSNHEVIVSDYWDKTKKNTITEDGQIHYNYFIETNARGEGDGYDQDVYLRGYDWCSQIYFGHCVVQKENSFGIINEAGHVTFPLSLMGDVIIAADEDGRICFKKHDEYKHITNDGRIKTQKGDHLIDLPVGIHWCKTWNEDFIEVECNGKWGLMNSKLEMIIDTKYEFIQYISNNYAFCRLKDNDRVVSILINVLTGDKTELPYHHCSEFENGCAIVSIVTKENKSSWSNRIDYEYAYGLIDYNGKELLPCNYKQIQFRVPPKVEHYSNYSYYEEPYSREDSLMDALDGCADAYWNID